jgi:DNA-binding NtrC family response regulator
MPMKKDRVIPSSFLSVSYMRNTIRNKKNEVILVLSNSGPRAFHQSLALRNRKILIRTFQEAGEAVRKCRAAIILSDCGSHTEKGMNILKQNKSRCRHIPNIFITNASYEGLVLKTLRSGARDFFREPINIIELQETVNGLIALRKKTGEIRDSFVHASKGMEYT